MNNLTFSTGGYSNRVDAVEACGMAWNLARDAAWDDLIGVHPLDAPDVIPAGSHIAGFLYGYGSQHAYGARIWREKP